MLYFLFPEVYPSVVIELIALKIALDKWDFFTHSTGDMRKIPTTREQVLAAWEITKTTAKRLRDAKAKLESLPDELPDMASLQAAIDAFRAEHAEAAKQREDEMATFRSRHLEEKRRRESEFSSTQRVAKTIADAGEEVKRAKKAFDIATRNQYKAEKNYIP